MPAYAENWNFARWDNKLPSSIIPVTPFPKTNFYHLGVNHSDLFWKNNPQNIQ
jgi:hypothetical protein